MADLVIVGAGPVGSLLALTLARRGHQVEVYGRRPDMRRVDIQAGRSINLAVSTRGLHALHEVGLDDDVLREAVPMLGRMTHALDGKLALLPYGRSEREFINSMSRGELNKLLMTRAEQTGRVRIHFGQRLMDYDPDRRVARFEPSGDARAEVIIGSDGSASALRPSLGGAVSQDVLSSGYKELTMPPKDGGFAMHPNALHIWPRGNFMLIALPNREGSFTCTLCLPFQGSPSFAELGAEVDAARFFEAWFPDSVRLIPGLARPFMQAPLGRIRTGKSWPWWACRPLRMWDGGGAIVPLVGPAGEIQSRILAELAKQPSPDYERGVHLAEEQLVPVLRSHGIV